MTESSRPVEAVRPLLGIKPPLVGFALIGIGVGIYFAANARIFPEGWVQFVVGVPLIVGGFVFGMLANVKFHRLGTDDRFSKPTSQIVQDGLFRYSRNPMYVGMIVIVTGAMLTLNSAWSLFVLPALYLYLHYGVIRREEAYLEQRFGDEYRANRGRVRRWL